MARVLKQFSYESMGECYRAAGRGLERASPQDFGETKEEKEVKDSEKLEMLKGKTVLVDLDNTSVDWDAEFIRRYSEATGQDVQMLEKLVRKRQHFEENLSPWEKQLALETIASPGFYENLRSWD